MSIKALLKKNKAVFRAAQAARTLPYPLLRGLCGLFRRACGIDRRTVYFSSFGGMLCNDNPRAVAEALHRLRPDLRFVFCLSGAGMRDRTLPDWIEAVPRRSLRALKALSTMAFAVALRTPLTGTRSMRLSCGLLDEDQKVSAESTSDSRWAW